MKSTIRSLGRLTLIGVMLCATDALAQPTVKESAQRASTATTTGTISQFGTGTLVVKTTTSSAPISYSYSKATTYFDQNGTPVSIETVKVGLPVTVYYEESGDKLVATKVVVTRTGPDDPYHYH